jgi:hypothetical protein
MNKLLTVEYTVFHSQLGSRQVMSVWWDAYFVPVSFWLN